MAKRKNLIGKKFGRLTVVGYTEKESGKRSYQLLCNCDCGATGVTAYAADLNFGNKKSCGCLKREMSSKREPNNALADKLVLDRKQLELIHLTKMFFRCLDSARP